MFGTYVFPVLLMLAMRATKELDQLVLPGFSHLKQPLCNQPDEKGELITSNVKAIKVFGMRR